MHDGRRFGGTGLLCSALMFSLGWGCNKEESVEPEATDEAGETEEVAEEGPDPTRIPVAGEGKERGRIQGDVEVAGFAGGLIHIDAVVEEEGENVVVAKATFDKPGPYRLVVKGEHPEVNLVVYLDVDGDGPTAGDRRYEYPGNPVALAEGERIEGLTIVVESDTEELAGEHDPDDNSPINAPTGPSERVDDEASEEAPEEVEEGEES